MELRAESWVQYPDFGFTPSSHPSGRESPHERQPMLPVHGEPVGVEPTRPSYDLDVTGHPKLAYGTPTNHSRHTSMSDKAVSFPSQDPLLDLSRSAGLEGVPLGHARMPRAASYKGIRQSPLNPSSPPSPGSTHFLSPFMRPASAIITRIPSEESRVLSLGTAPNPRASMVLYRKADSDDLTPPLLPYAKRNSIPSIDSVSVSSDSKYPLGTMSTGRVLVAYAWDPLVNDNGPIDEEDNLHDPQIKMQHDDGRAMSLRGFINVASLLVLVSGMLTLFVMYPVYTFYHNNGVNALIVGNTRINATGQASSVVFDPRSQIPLLPNVASIDPTTPQEALKTSRNGALYKLVFSDEFNTDGRSFYRGDDVIWETASDSDTQSIVTHNGSLVLKAHSVSFNGHTRGLPSSSLLFQRTTICIKDGFVEMAITSPSSSARHGWSVFTGIWGDMMSARSSDELLLYRLPSGLGPTDAISIDYVRFYQRDTVTLESCDDSSLRWIEFLSTDLP